MALLRRLEGRFTARNPRVGLAVAEWAIVAIMVGLAIRSNNVISVVLVLIPVPFLVVASFAEMSRADREERERARPRGMEQPVPPVDIDD